MLEPMFDQAGGIASDRQLILAELRRRMIGGSASVNGAASASGAPVVPATAATFAMRPVAGDAVRSVLAVPAPLAAILPDGGLPRGAVVSLGDGGGATSLLFTLLAAPSGAWSALVGMPDIGLLAAAEMGVDLDRLVLIPEPGPDVLQVLSVLADGVDIIAVATGPGATPGATPARLRVLTARLRQSGAVLVVTGRWPGADLVLDSRIEGWTGLGRGHGRLRNRELIVEVRGRGSAGRSRSTGIFLQSSRSRVDVADGPDRFGPAAQPMTMGSMIAEPMIAEVG